MVKKEFIRLHSSHLSPRGSDTDNEVTAYPKGQQRPHATSASFSLLSWKQADLGPFQPGHSHASVVGCFYSYPDTERMRPPTTDFPPLRHPTLRYNLTTRFTPGHGKWYTRFMGDELVRSHQDVYITASKNIPLTDCLMTEKTTSVDSILQKIITLNT